MEEYQPLIVAAAAAVVAIVVIAVIWTTVRRRRRALALQAPIPLIPFSSNHISIGRPSRSEGPPTPPREASVARTVDTSTWAPPASAARSVGVPGGPPATRPGSAVNTPPFARPVAAPSGALYDAAVVADEASGAPVDGASVRFWRPADGTLQFLPGRLEVIAGRDAGHEIRFVRTPGPEGTHVTFGRAEGAPYRHVQLREPTVSRAHARMTLEPAAGTGSANGPRWRLENLSATNPVVVNGRPLGADGGPSCSVTLVDGDRIEMGEVVFRFHEK